MTEHDDQQQPTTAPGRGTEGDVADMIHHEHATRDPGAGVIQAGETGVDDDGATEVEQGADVLCQDGEKIGEVVEVRPGYLVVEEGFFDPQDLFIPLEYVEDHDETRLVLSITREMFEASDWTAEPDADDS